MTARSVATLGTVALTALAAPVFAQTAPRPEFRAVRAASAPIIDGALDDEVWREAPVPAGEWLSYNPLHGQPIPQTTTVWIAFDADYLYFAFKCDDPNPSRIKTSITRRDNIWQDDWVGLSLDALGTGQLSYHMMVNPSGVQLDMLNSVADFYDEENTTTLTRFSNLVQPVLLIVMGVIIAFLLMSLYMPLFNLSSLKTT